MKKQSWLDEWAASFGLGLEPEPKPEPERQQITVNIAVIQNGDATAALPPWCAKLLGVDRED